MFHLYLCKCSVDLYKAYATLQINTGVKKRKTLKAFYLCKSSNIIPEKYHQKHCSSPLPSLSPPSPSTRLRGGRAPVKKEIFLPTVAKCYQIVNQWASL